MSERAWIIHGPDGWGSDGAVVIFADSRGQAKALGAHEMDIDFIDARCRRAGPADGSCKAGISDAVMREIGFWGEDEMQCKSCGLGDYSNGKRPEWAICDHCGQCGECGCCGDCGARDE